MDVLGVLGSATLLDDLERFVCCMYGKAQFSSINKLRYDSFSQKYQSTSRQVLSSFAGMVLSLLPRFRASLDVHAQRAKLPSVYMVSCTHKQFSNVLSLDGHGWKIDEEGAIDYEWTSRFIVPQK